MSDDCQIDIPRSFIELYLAPGSVRPNQSRTVIASRYELCEDMAQMLVDHARAKLFELGVTEHDVLERTHRGLLVEGSTFSADEANWLVRRLAELLGWPRLIEQHPD
ncbi:MAG: ATPase with chaperone activity [Pseudomonadota bacterium]|nr:ATPase with chaperone activity [Pseudomonadota bacterium]